MSLRLRLAGLMALPVAGLIGLLPCAAAAQSVSLPAAPTRPDPRASTEEPLWISFNDCIIDDHIEFRPRLEGFTGFTLAVWVGMGADCTQPDNRDSTDPECWKVYENVNPTDWQPTVQVRVQDVVAGFRSTASFGGPGSGTCDDCLAYAGQDGPQPLTFYLMLVDNRGNQPEGAVPAIYEDTSLDLLGPPAPTNVEVGVGEERLIVEWDSTSSGDDVAGFRLYCDDGSAPANVPGSVCPASAGGPGSGGASTSSGAGGVSPGGTPGAGAPGTGDAGLPSAANPECPSVALIPGIRPPASLRDCGVARGNLSSDGAATGLTNLTAYAVAVAAYDSVGNVGPLSEVRCGTPEPVADFFEAYREAGGSGGGGFCSVARRPWIPAGFMLAAAAALCWLRRRSR